MTEHPTTDIDELQEALVEIRKVCVWHLDPKPKTGVDHKYCLRVVTAIAELAINHAAD